MIRILALTLAALATPAFAQPPVPAATPAALAHVVLTTAQGPITLAIETGRAPATAANFLKYVDQKRLDGTSFYRASKVPGAPDQGLVQGGVRYDPKRVLPPIKHEPTSQTGLRHLDGTISMARNAPGTAAGDFFIVVGDMPYMDANPAGSGDNQGYAAFGRVVAGMDVVRGVLGAPVGTEGEGVMKGEMLAVPVRIVTARRTTPPPLPPVAPVPPPAPAPAP